MRDARSLDCIVLVARAHPDRPDRVRPRPRAPSRRRRRRARHDTSSIVRTEDSMSAATTGDADATSRSARDARWHGLTAEEAAARLEVDPRSGLDAAEVERRRARVRPEQARGGGEGAGLAGVPAPVPRPDAARPARRRDRQHRRAAGVLDGHRDHRPDRAERGPRPEPGGQGGGERRRAPEDAPDQGARPPRRRSGSTSPPRSSCPGDIVSFEAGDKVPADGRLLVAATLEIEEAALTGESTPVLKSVDPVPGDDVPLGDRLDMAYMNSTVTRGRGEMVVTATGMATEVGQISGMLSRRPAGEDAAHAPARPADRPDHDHGRGRAGARDRLRADPRRRLRRPVPDRDQPRDRGDPDRPAGGRHDDALARDAGARGEGRDREAAAVGGDARLDLGDLLGQDRHADAQPDDRAPARRRRPPLLGRGRGLLDGGQDPARRGRQRTRRSSRSCCRWRSPTTRRCATARSSATRPRRRSSCSPPRAGSTSTRRGASTRASARCRSTPSTSSWRPSTRWRTTAARSSAASSRARRTCCSRARRRSATPTARTCRRRAARDRVLAENDRLAGEGLRVLAVATRDIDPSAFDRRRRRCSTRCRT